MATRSWKFNRYLDRSTEIAALKDRVFNPSGDGIGQMAFVRPSVAVCFGEYYAGCYFCPISIYQTSGSICGGTWTSMCICAMCGCSLGGTWTPMANTSTCGVTLAMRVG